MIKVYAVSLVLGVLGLLISIFGAALAESFRRPAIDPSAKLGRGWRLAVGALAGFGMGGMSAEFSPLGLGTGISFAIALGAALVGTLWVAYAAPVDR